MKRLFFSLLLLAGIAYVTSYNILFMLAFASQSHRNVFNPVAEALAKKGHKITIFSQIEHPKPVDGITEIWLHGMDKYFANFSMFQGKTGDSKMMHSITDILNGICRGTYEHPEVTNILKNPKAYNFDVVIIDGVFNDFSLPIGHHLGIPNIVMCPGPRFGPTAWSMNIPHPPSYIPSGLDENSDRMTFSQRLWNFVGQLGFTYMRHRTMFPGYDKIIAEFLPNSPTIFELEKNISFLITNTNPAISNVVPTMPYTAEIGGVHCKPAKALPKDLEDFMTSSGDVGVIYFSLGSITKGESMPEDMRDKIYNVFKKLPQKILWKYEQEIKDLPKHITLTKWAPQQDLLAHNKTRLFITHGGGLSTSEAVYHGCPVLGFPLSADQWGNMAIAAKKGYGEYLDWQTFTEEELMEKIQKMLTDDSYQKAADYYSAIYRDNPQPPIERAVYWVEYVARHKGAPHLKSAAENLNTFQYFLLDVIGAILLALGVVLVLIFLVLRTVCRVVCKKWCQKTASTKASQSKKRN